MPDEAFGLLVTTEVAETMGILAKAYDLAREYDDAIAAQINEQLIGFIRDVNNVAIEMTGRSEGLIISKIYESHSAGRPLTGNMESHIISRPGPFGLVEVALIDELDKIRNPNGDYGPFWRAQEYGTGSDEVPSQEGRVLFGTYEESGTPPDPAQRGLGKGHDIAFVPGGANAGWGTIHTELPARHFLRDGYAAAAEDYERRMNEVRAKWDAQIIRMIEQLRRSAAEATRGFLGIIEA